jgi:hypothetical protein
MTTLSHVSRLAEFGYGGSAGIWGEANIGGAGSNAAQKAVDLLCSLKGRYSIRVMPGAEWEPNAELAIAWRRFRRA